MELTPCRGSDSLDRCRWRWIRGQPGWNTGRQLRLGCWELDSGDPAHRSERLLRDLQHLPVYGCTDSDGDGYWDTFDDLPDDPTGFIDQDGDGSPRGVDFDDTDVLIRTLDSYCELYVENVSTHVSPSDPKPIRHMRQRLSPVDSPLNPTSYGTPHPSKRSWSPLD